MKRINYLLSFSILLLGFSCSACSKSDPNPNVKKDPKDSTQAVTGNGGYLFAHIKNSAEYGHMVYDLSRDGMKWTRLNNGEEPLPTYYGHPYIVRGGDGKYYLIGTSTGTAHHPVVFYSEDCVAWKRHDISKETLALPDGYIQDEWSYGALKIFYDDASGQYMITWHAHNKTESNQAKWESMRTFYVLTKDFKTFTPTKKLFNDFTGADVDIATIDVSIHKYEGKYYAILKDERWPETVSTGKTIRVCVSDNLLGPYSNPMPTILQNWREAPTLTMSLDGKLWYLYVEDYRKAVYELWTSEKIVGGTWTKSSSLVAPEGRHGCVIKIDEKTYQALEKAYLK